MKKLIYIFVPLFLLFAVASLALPVYARDSKYICSVYFTGIGCPHCARADPFVLGMLPEKYPKLIIIEYEIYQQKNNAQLLYSYNDAYNSGLGIPLIIFSKENRIIGDEPILNNIESKIKAINSNSCPLINGSSASFDNLDITSLPGKPKIWADNRILLYNGGGGKNNILKELLTENISEALKRTKFEVMKPMKVPLSGRYVNFDNAVKLDGWIFQWNGMPYLTPQLNSSSTINNSNTVTENVSGKNILRRKLTFAKVLSLAAVDSVNPCALAVLTLMLVSIITYNPKKKRNVLLSGVAFISSVYVMYLFYGLVIIKFFQLVQALTTIRLVLYKSLGILAVILGVLNIRDFIHYKPGGFGTEMPMSLRPKAKKLISSITSPKGAFTLGLFVTLFLLPCTIGPYVIAGGILSTIELFEALPWLLFYNIIFVLPMVAIVLVIYKGITTVEDISGWREKNIRYLHLIAGTIIVILGLGMSLGLF